MRSNVTFSYLSTHNTKSQRPIWLILLLSCFLFQHHALAVSEREQKIIASNTLKVCIWPDYFSISYKNKKNDQLEGIDIELSQALAQDLGVNIEYVNTHFGVFIDDIQQDKCDIAMFGVGITAERANDIDYSEPYLSSSMYGITSKTHPALDTWEAIDQAGVIVCVQQGTYMDSVMRSRLQQAQLMTVVQSSQREVEVRSGRADVFITDYPYAQKALQFYDWAKLLQPQQATAQFQYAYAIKKDQPLWLARVNTFVQAIKADGRLEQAAQKNNLLPIALIHDSQDK